MSDEERVVGEYGHVVPLEDRDHLYQQAMMHEQRDWEKRWFFATDDTAKQEFQRGLRDLQVMCRRAATAIEMHWISPRAMEAIRKAIMLWPSGALATGVVTGIIAVPCAGEFATTRSAQVEAMVLCCQGAVNCFSRGQYAGGDSNRHSPFRDADFNSGHSLSAT